MSQKQVYYGNETGGLSAAPWMKNVSLKHVKCPALDEKVNMWRRAILDNGNGGSIKFAKKLSTPVRAAPLVILDPVSTFMTCFQKNIALMLFSLLHNK